MTLDLAHDETRALVRVFRHAIDDDAYPFAPRLAQIRDDATLRAVDYVKLRVARYG